MMNKIYFDNASTTPIKDFVMDEFMKIEKNNWYNPETKYSNGIKSRNIIEEAKEIIARSIGAKPNEIFFTSGATESNNLAMNIAVNIGGHISTSNVEHKSIYNSPSLKKYNNIGQISVDNNGMIKLNELYDTFANNDYGVISVIAVNNETGAINPIDTIGKLCDRNGWIFHTDATQALGKIDINVKDMCIGMLSATGHKLGTFKNIGFLYVDESLHKYITPIIGGGMQQNGFRAGTESASLCMSLAVAVDRACKRAYIGIPIYTRYSNIIKKEMYKNNIDYTENCKFRKTNSIMSLTIKGVNAENLVQAADLCGLCISNGSACNSESIEPSYVLSAIGLNKKDAISTIRISFTDDMSEKDILDGAKLLVKAIKMISEE